MRTLQESRDEAEEALRDTFDRLSVATASAAAAQFADAAGETAADMGEELLEASEELVDVIEELPGGTTVGQVVDIVLLPGRLALRIATTVLRGTPKKESAG